MKFDDFKKLSPEGQILAREMMEIKTILFELRDGVQELDREETDGRNESEGPDRSKETTIIPSAAVGPSVCSPGDGERGGQVRTV